MMIDASPLPLGNFFYSFFQELEGIGKFENKSYIVAAYEFSLGEFLVKFLLSLGKLCDPQSDILLLQRLIVAAYKFYLGEFLVKSILSLGKL